MKRDRKANIEQRNWRSWKRGKEWVFGCSLLLSLGTASLLASTTTGYAEQLVMDSDDSRTETEANTTLLMEERTPAESLDDIQPFQESTESANDNVQENEESLVKVEDSSGSKSLKSNPLSTTQEVKTSDEANDIVQPDDNTIEANDADYATFRRGIYSSPTSTHSEDGLRITKGQYDIEFTDAGELASRAGKGDIGFVKLNDSTAAYLFNFGDRDNISLVELRDRIILRPKEGGAPVYGNRTSDYRIVTENGTKYFRNRRNNNVEVLYLVSITPAINTEPNHVQRVIGTKSDGDGGEGHFNRLVPFSINSGYSTITLPDQHMVTSMGFYSYSLHYGDRVVMGNTRHQTSMNFFLIAVDNKRPVVNEEVTKANFERALGDSQLNKDNIDRIMTLSNVEVTDNVLRKSTLQTPEYTNILLRDEQGREHTVAELKALLNGPDATNYANKNYAIIIKTSDLVNAAETSLVSSENIVMGIVDKTPLQEAKERANAVNTAANTQDQSPDSANAYNAAVIEFNRAKQQAQNILNKSNATVEEILNAIRTLEEKSQQVTQKERELVPSQASTHQVIGGRLVKYVTDSVTAEDLKETITNLPSGARVAFPQPFVNPNMVGEHYFDAIITYADRSEKALQLILVQNKDPRALQSTLEQLIANIEMTVETENKAPNAVTAYNEELERARQLRDSAQKVLQEVDNPNTTQNNLDSMSTAVAKEIQDLTAKRIAITDSMAFLNPIYQLFELERKMHDEIQESDLLGLTADLQGQPVVSLNSTFVKPAVEGTYQLKATARYSDGSTNTVTIHLRLVTDWTEFNQISSEIATEIHVEVERENMNPMAVKAYDEALKRAEAIYEQLQALRQSDNLSQATLDNALPLLRQEVNKLVADLQEKRQAIVPSLASQYPVAQPATIVRSIKNPASESEILAAVALPEYAERAEFATDTNRQWDRTQTYPVAIDVIYSDSSVNRVTVLYTLNKDWSLLEEATDNANARVQEIESNPDLLVDKRPSTIDAYRQALKHAKNQIEQAMQALQDKNVNTPQLSIDYYENQVKQAIIQLNDSIQKLEPSDASVYSPIAGTIVRTTKTLANEQALKEAISNYPATAIISLVNPYNIPTTKGTHKVQAIVHYKDQTRDTVDITYIINLDFAVVNQLKDELQSAIDYGHGDANLDAKTKASVENYQAKLAAAISVTKHLEVLVADPNIEQAQLDRFENTLRSTLADLRNAVNYYLVDSEATIYTPSVSNLVRDTNTLATAEEIAGNVYVSGTYGYSLSLSPGQEVPKSEGVYTLRVTVVYKDESSEEVEVNYTVNTYKRRLQEATYNLNSLLQGSPVLSDKSPDTVAVYEQALANAQQIIQESQAIEQAINSSQKVIDEAERKTKEALAALMQARDGLQRSQAAIHTPRMERLEKTMRETIELADFRASLKDIPGDTIITTNQEIVKREGSNTITLTIHYPDRSTEDINVYYYYITVKTDLTVAMDTLHQQIIERPVTADMRPNTVEAYHAVLLEAERLYRQETNTMISEVPQSEIDAATERIKAISEQLQIARSALTIKDSVTYPVPNGQLMTTIKNLATNEQLLQALGDLPGGAVAEITRTYSNHVGTHYVQITLTYPDDSTNSVHVEYTITLHKEDLANANSALEKVINQAVNLENVSPRAIRAYQATKSAQENELAHGQQIHDTGNQDQIDLAVTRMEVAKERLLEAIRELVPSEAFMTTPTNGTLTRTVKQTVTLPELLQTIGGIPETARVELAPNVMIPHNEVKMHILNAIVTYQDESVDQVEIHLTLTTDLSELNQDTAMLEAELTREPEIEGKRPATVEAYQEARANAQEKLTAAQQILQNPLATQTVIDQAAQEATQATERLRVARADIVDSDATIYQPIVAELTRTMKNLALENDIFQQITIQGATFTTTLASALALPNVVGKHKVIVQILYGDRSREDVEVPYTITVDITELSQKNSQLYIALQQPVDIVDKTKASIEQYESEKQRIVALLATARNVEQTEVQDQQRIDDEAVQVSRALQDLQAAINQLTDTQAKLINPEITQYHTNARNLATVMQLTEAVNIPETAGYHVNISNYTDDNLPTEIGTHILMGTVVYQDESSEQVRIEYIIAPYQDDLITANIQLSNKLLEPITTDQKRPATIRNYEQALANARNVQEQTQRMLEELSINSGPSHQAHIDDQARLTNEAYTQLVSAINGLEDSDEKIYIPSAQPLTRTLKYLASAQDLAQQVNGVPQNATIIVVESTVPQQVGEYRVIATVNYSDETSETVEIFYTITTDKEALSQAIAILAQTDSTAIELAGIRPSDIERYQNAKQQAETVLEQARALFRDKDSLQTNIDEMVEAVNAAQTALQYAQMNLNPSEATLYTPTVRALIRTVRNLVTVEQAVASIAIPEVQGYQVILDESELPQTIGTHQINATVVYVDNSVERVMIPYTITTDKEPLASANESLIQVLNAILPTDIRDMSPVTVTAFEKAQQDARTLLEEARRLHDTATDDQVALDQMTERIAQSQAKVVETKAALRQAQSVSVQLMINPLVVTIKNLANQADLKARVINAPEDAQIVLVNEQLPIEEGIHEIVATVRYIDQSEKDVIIRYEITSDKNDLIAALGYLHNEKDQVADIDGMKPQAIDDYRVAQAQAATIFAQAQAILNNPSSKQADLDVAQHQVEEATQHLQQAKQALVPSIATLTQPQERALTRTVTNLANSSDIIHMISSQTLPEGTRFILQHADAIPMDLGTHILTVKVVYEDRSEDIVKVRYTVTTDVSGLELAKQALSEELAKPVNTDGKRQSTIELLEMARRGAVEALGSAQEVLDVAGPTQDTIEATVAKIREKLQVLQQAVAGLEDSYATQYTPTGGQYERTVKQPVDLSAILSTITTPGGNPTVQLPNGVSLPIEVGMHRVEVLVVYADQSTDTAIIQYTITTHKADLADANQVLNTQVERIPVTEGKRQSTIDQYDKAQKAAEAILVEAQAVLADLDATQSVIDDMLARVNQAQTDLIAAVNTIVDADATTYTPNNGTLTAKATQVATKEQLEATITVDGLDTIQVLLDNEIPPTEVGIYHLAATVIYADGSSEKVFVDYTILLDTEGLQVAKNQLEQKLGEYVKETDRSQATLNQYQLAKEVAQNTVVLSEQFLREEAATAKQPAADIIERQLENAYAELVKAIEALRDSQASVNQPNITPLTRTLKDQFETQHLVNQVTDLPKGAHVVIAEPEAIPTEVGHYRIAAIIYYEDLSTKDIEIPYEITTYTDELAEAQHQLQLAVDTIPITSEKSPMAVRRYQALLAQARQKIVEVGNYLSETTAPQSTLNDLTNQLQQMKQQLEEAMHQIIDSQAKLNNPQVTDLRTKVTAPVTAEQLIQQVVTVPSANIQLQLPNGAIPTAVGRYEIPVQVIYEDESVDNVSLVLVIEVDTAALNKANVNLDAFLAQPVDIAMKSPDSLATYQAALRLAQETLRNSQNIAATEMANQAAIDEAKVATEQAMTHLQAAIDQLVPSEASQYTPASDGLTRTMRQQADVDTLVKTVQGQPSNAVVQIVSDIPTTEGKYQVEALVTYNDRSTATVLIPYVLYADKTDLGVVLAKLVEQLQQEIDINDKKPDAIDVYHQAKAAAAQALAVGESISREANSMQIAVDNTTTALQNALRDLQVAINGLVPSQAATTALSDGSLQRHVNNKATATELKGQIGMLPEGATATIQEIPQTVGRHEVVVSVEFADRSTKQFTVNYEIILDKEPLMQANDILAQAIAQKVILDDKSPTTARAYRDAKYAAEQVLVATRAIYATESESQTNIDVATARVHQATDQLQLALRNLKLSQAAQNTPLSPTVDRTMRTLATQDELIQAVELASVDAVVELLTEVPRKEGIHTVQVRITYADQSVDDVVITYIVHTVKKDLISAIESLMNQINENVDRVGKRPATVTEYERVKQLAEKLVTQAAATLLNDTTKQTVLDATTELVNQMREQLMNAVANIVDSDATTHQPENVVINRTVKQLATEQELLNSIIIPSDIPNTAIVLEVSDLPNTVGVHEIRAVVTYPDTTQDIVQITYMIETDKSGLQQANEQLIAQLTAPIDLSDMSPSTLEVYREALVAAKTAQQLAATILGDANRYGDQNEIDAYQAAALMAQEALVAAIHQLKKAENFIYNPTANAITRTLRELASPQELVSLIRDIPTTAVVQLVNPDKLPESIGVHAVEAVVRYADHTEEIVTILYTIRTYKDELAVSFKTLKQLVDEDINTMNKAPLTVEHYHQSIKTATHQLAAARAILDDEQAEQTVINEARQLVAEAELHLKAAIQALVDSQASTNKPHIDQISRTVKHLMTAQEMINQIDGLPESAIVTVDESIIPTTVGKHRVKLHIQYEDLSTTELVVEYIVTVDKDKLTEVENSLRKQLATLTEMIHHHPGIQSQFEAIQHNMQQHLVQIQHILSDLNATQEGIDRAEATAHMIEAQLKLLMSKEQLDNTELPSTPQVIPGCPTCGGRVVDSSPAIIAHKQLPATGEVDTNLFVYTLATLTGLVGTLLGRKKKEDAEV